MARLLDCFIGGEVVSVHEYYTVIARGTEVVVFVDVTIVNWGNFGLRLSIFCRSQVTCLRLKINRAPNFLWVKTVIVLVPIGVLDVRLLLL